MEQFSNKAHVLIIAQAEMTKWGLDMKGWKFKIDNATSRHGCCDYKALTLSVSSNRITYDSKEDVVNTIRHEIAHALHYEEYNAAGLIYDFFRRNHNGRRIVRPHGREWKTIARRVGVSDPKSASAGNARKERVMNWRMVIVHANKTVEDGNHGCTRFLKHMSRRYMTGRKNSTIGKLFLVNGTDWKAVQDGTLCVNDLKFYQQQDVEFTHGTLFRNEGLTLAA
jgi:hypothetical protein